MHFAGKNIVITGVSSGIGARTAQLALYAGANVIGIDRHVSSLPLTQFIEADLASSASISAALRQLPGRIDAFVNNAGVSGEAGAAKVLAINFYGLRQLTLGAQALFSDGASIINVASMAGFSWAANIEKSRALVQLKGFPDTAALVREHDISDQDCYCLSKEMLRIWTMQQAHAASFKARAIRLNTVSPGPVETPILGEFVRNLGEARVSADVARVGRAGVPSDIAPVILFLASDAARWVNGANLPVDGGLEAAVFGEMFHFGL